MFNGRSFCNFYFESLWNLNQMCSLQNRLFSFRVLFPPQENKVLEAVEMKTGKSIAEERVFGLWIQKLNNIFFSSVLIRRKFNLFFQFPSTSRHKHTQKKLFPLLNDWKQTAPKVGVASNTCHHLSNALYTFSSERFASRAKQHIFQS